MTIPIILPTTPVTEANEDDLLQIQSPEIVRSILEANFATQKQQPMPTQLVTPQPGFVIKTRAIQVGETQIRKGEKVFINVGGEVGIPGAPDISDVRDIRNFKLRMCKLTRIVARTTRTYRIRLNGIVI